ncbi:hypothetical protein PR048_002973 [Dryococelus australis]|uniref:Uncharacterized protein n=1 Tax=Dryococelus australis TaxID=614101 RepID=A0ABQ9IN46_9NEOP|nr:hypothetical protein PR048_002973 [Dryococelus australis]
MKLADPTFHTSGAIDILLGAELYPEVVDDGRIIGTSGIPSALHSILILIVRVACSEVNSNPASSFFVHSEKSLDVTMKHVNYIFTNLALVTTLRQYIVGLPFKEDCAPDLGVSHHLERWLSSMPALE